MTLVLKRFFETESCTYTYFVGDSIQKEGVFIDTVQKEKNIYSDYILKNNFTLKYLLETHVHADHITAAGPLKEMFPNATLALHKDSGVQCPFYGLSHGDTLNVGQISIQVLGTPGHTLDSVCYLINEYHLFTGDTLLIGSCGRTDFQSGSTAAMHKSLALLMELGDEVLVYPGHDYHGRHVSSIGEQRATNALLGLSLEAFTKELEGWKLPPPKHIHTAVPGNLLCGKV